MEEKTKVFLSAS